MSSGVETSVTLMSEERKTPEMREQMTDIERLRPSTAHVLAFCHVERSRDISHYYARGS